MDKICRGSAIGDAHNQGSWADVSPPVENRNHRGTHICGTSLKLENTSPGAQQKHLQRQSSDTFRSQDWFRHDLCGRDLRVADVPQLSPRFWQSGERRSSPRGLANRSKSQKSLQEEESSNLQLASPRRAVDIQRPAGVTRSRSVGLLGMQGIDDADISIFDGQPLPENPRSPRSPRCDVPVPAGLPVQRGRKLDLDAEARPATEKRPNSPTYAVSENWMNYSSGKGVLASDSPALFMPSQNFSSKLRRQHSGKQLQESEYWLESGYSAFSRSDLAAEPAAPSSIHDVHSVASKGKKTNIARTADGAKRRLQLDKGKPDKLDFRRSERKHNFVENPQSNRMLEEFKQHSPRLMAGDNSAVGSAQQPCMADVQHRTSAEMAMAMMPEQLESPANPEQRKYMVGHEVVSWANCGRRGAPECFLNTQRVAAQICQEAGGFQAHPSQRLGAVRDHRNSELVRDHLKSHSPKWQEQLTVGINQMPTKPGPSPRIAAPPPVAGLVAFGDVSCLPSTMPKDTAYLQSGLKVYRHGSRTPGYFSPHMPHAQIMV